MAGTDTIKVMRDIAPLEEASDYNVFGGKAGNLATLLKSNLPVPAGYAISIHAFDRLGKLKEDIRSETKYLLNASKLYAVRSSALEEDSLSASWAGQFESFLNVDFKDVVAKVEACHNSNKARTKAYASDKPETNKFDIAVVVLQLSLA
jgi:rifampicin phosphotransferase